MRHLLLLLLFSVFCFQNVYAVSVKFTRDHIVLGKHNSATLIVQNPAKQFKAVEVSVQTRHHSLQGKEQLGETEDFLILPPQLIIGPQQERVVTIQWLGTPSLDKELPYRVIVEEVPIPDKNKIDDVDESSASVEIRLRFVNSFYVRPKKVNANIQFLSALPTANNQMVITVRNNGSKHWISDDAKLTLSNQDGDYKTKLKSDQFKQKINILPGENRTLFIDWPSTVPVSTYTHGEFEINDL
jgi:fimbrial chaperone protein